MKPWPEFRPWAVVTAVFIVGAIGGMVGATLTPGGKEILGEPSIVQENLATKQQEILGEIQQLHRFVEVLSGQMEARFSALEIQRLEVARTPTNVENHLVPPSESEIDSSMQWPSVLPKRIALELIVRGLSPYDNSTIATAARLACTSFDHADRQHRDAREALRQERLGGLPDSEFIIIRSRNDFAFEAQLDEAISALRETLDSLTE